MKPHVEVELFKTGWRWVLIVDGDRIEGSQPYSTEEVAESIGERQLVAYLEMEAMGR